MAILSAISRWRVTAGYVAFGLLALVLCLYVTFPYDAVRQRLTSEAESMGFDLKMATLGPGLFGVSASNVQIGKKAQAGSDAPATVFLKSVSLRPSLFPFGLAFNGKVFGGAISGSVGGVSDLAVNLNLEKLDAGDANLKQLSGLNMDGKASSEVSLAIPSVPTPGTKGREPDLSRASGNLSLKLDQFIVKSGTLTLPLYGEPTPVDVPRLALGNVECQIKFDKGVGKIERLQGRGDDIEIMATGTVKLAKRIDYSETNLDFKFKSESGLIKSLSSMLPMDKENPGFRSARITGFLGRPNFSPGR